MHSHSLQTLGQYDPTHTTVLRDQFAKDMKRRFKELKIVVRKAIVEQDCLGLASPSSSAATGLRLVSYASMTLPGAQAFDFPRSSDKISAFMEWLNEQVERGLLEIGTIPQIGGGIEEAWTSMYLHTAYQKGLVRTRQELAKAGYRDKHGELVPLLEDEGMVQAAFNMPQHADRAGVIFTRVYEDLKGITAQMSTQLSRILSQGILDGEGPRSIARTLLATISGPLGDLGITDTLGRFIPAERRAVMLARTEIIRAHHLAMMQEYDNWGVLGITVKAEWQTAGDSRVCEKCASLQGKVFTLKEITPKIPLHPQCRCVALPLPVNEGD